MRSPVRVFVWFAVVVVLILGVALTVHLLTPPPELKPIAIIEFSQSKSVPNFDTSPRKVTVPTRIAAFEGLVKKFSIDVGNFDTTLNDKCTGGLATNITLDFTDSTTQSLRIYDCAGTTARGTFVTDATSLFTSWR